MSYMKYSPIKQTICACILILCGVVAHGQVPIRVIFDKQAYLKVAKQRFFEDPGECLYSSQTISDSAQLHFISIPVYRWKQNQHYRCGDNIEPLIDFSQDVMFQKVFVLENNGKNRMNKVGAFTVSDSYQEEARYQDSITGGPYWVPRAPFLPADGTKLDDKIHQYCIDNPDILVFIIYGMKGYWAVINGELRKLFYRFGRITGVSANKHVVYYYGEDYINHVMEDGLRICYPYYGCPEVKVNDPIPIVVNFK